MSSTVFVYYKPRDDEGRYGFHMLWWDGYLCPVRGQVFLADPRPYHARALAAGSIVEFQCYDLRALDGVLRHAQGIVAAEHVDELRAMVRRDRDGLMPWERTCAAMAREALACVPAVA